jgi:hypothetical protein
MSLIPSELRDEQLRASNLMIEESAHHRNQCNDPGSKRVLYMSDQDMLAMRAKFPFLREFSDNFIRSTPPESLLKMEATTIKMRESERSRDADDKLAANRAALSLTAKTVQQGTDDRWSVLHEGRFLPGAGCSAAKLWLRAREVIGLTGAPPIGNYDLGAVGLGGFVSARGWVELANPSSTKVSLRLFSLNNCSSKLSTSKAEATELPLPDFAEIGEFQLALRTLRTAAAFVSPWNMSYAALENFLINSKFCADDLGGVDKPAVILTQFVDYTLVENAARWRDCEPFLTSGELKNSWQAFFSARPQSALRKQNQNQSSSNKQQRPNQFNKGSFNKGVGFISGNRRPFIDVCYNFNKGLCQKPAGQCVAPSGTPLRHVCDHRPDPSNLLIFCGQNHKRIDNH